MSTCPDVVAGGLVPPAPVTLPAAVQPAPPLDQPAALGLPPLARPEPLAPVKWPLARLRGTRHDPPPGARAPVQRQPRRRRAAAARIAAAVVAGLLMLAVLDTRGDDKPPVPGAPATAGQAATGSSVGMPVPVGNAPVKPVRIVLSLGRAGLPARERRALAEWITVTQHAGTRVRVRQGGRLSAPVSGGALRAQPRLHSASGPLARRWLAAGARRQMAGAALRIGAGAPSLRLPSSPRLRTVTVPARAGDRSVYRRLAARIARQIMVSARQGESR